MIALPDDSPLWHWQPQATYYLLDMADTPGEALARTDSLAALLFRLEQRQDPAALSALIDDVMAWFRRHPGYEGLKRLFRDLVKQAIIGAGVATPIPDDLQEVKTMLATLGQVWQEQWRTEVLAEGQRAGQAHALLRQLERRFGPVSDAVRAQVSAADVADLDLWLDRVIDAATIDAVFGDTSEG